MIRHPKKRGEWVELQFMARAAANGLSVAKPWGDSEHYDFIVEANGVFHRVQVKSSMAMIGNQYVASCHPPTRPKQGYTEAEIDFLAVFIIPINMWYVIPASALRGRKFGIALNPWRPRSKYARYLEAWHLLSGGGGARRLSKAVAFAPLNPRA